MSPELVLVDPELRRALQAQALERPPLQLVIAAEPPLPMPARARVPLAIPKLLQLHSPASIPLALPLPPPETAPPRWRRALAWPRRRLVPVLLPISLALNAILIALAVSDATVAPQSTALPPALNAKTPVKGNRTGSPSPKAKARPARVAKHSAAPTSSAKKRPGRFARAVRSRSPALERKLLNLLVQAPAGKLPRALIDSKTGLAKNNLQAVCRRSGGSRSFLCVVQPAKHKPGEGLYVRYRRAHKGTGGTFTSYHYRSG